MQSCIVEYCKIPVSADEFSSKPDSPAGSLFSPPVSPPDLTGFKERYLLAAMKNESDPEYRLYQMDGEIWFVELREVGIWCVYRLVKTETTTLADLERAMEVNKGSQPPAPSPAFCENKMTLKDVYTLARKGEALTLYDFEPFYYQLIGSDFKVRRYDAAGADTVFVRIEDGKLESARLMSGRTLDPSWASQPPLMNI